MITVQLNKIPLRHSLLALTCLLLAAAPSKAQLQGNDGFIRNTFIEAGFSKIGTFGSYGAAPVGYHPRNAPRCPSPGDCNGIGFVADPNNTGWTDYYGDFFLPSTPYEGFSVVSVLGTSSTLYFNTRDAAEAATPGITPSPGLELLSLTSIRWTGQVAGVFRVVNTHTINDRLIENTVTITNLSAETRTFYIARSVDPDNEAPKTGNHATTNKIESQGDGTSSKVSWVSASATDNSCVSYFTRQANAMVAFGTGFGVIPNNPKALWDNPNSTSAPVTQEGYSSTSDTEIGIAFRELNVAPGESRTVTYEIRLDQPPVVSFAGANQTRNEGETFTFTLARQYKLDEAVDVTIRLAAGAGITKDDFVGVSALPKDYVVTIPAGETSASFSITAAYDALLESNEIFSVEIVKVESSVGGIIATPKTLTGTIVDVPLPIATISASLTSIEEGGAATTFTVSLSKAPIAEVGPAIINLSYAGTATMTTDYLVTVGTNAVSATKLQIPVGQTTATFTLRALTDAIYEPGGETVALTLAPESGAVNGSPSSATIMIVDKNTPPALSVSSPSATEGSNLSFVLTLTGDACSKNITASYATADGTAGDKATAPADYTALSGTVTFLPGESSKTISVATLTDSWLEGNEKLSLALSSPVNCTLSGGAASLSAVGTIVDNTPGDIIVVLVEPASGSSVNESGSTNGKYRIRFKDTAVKASKNIQVSYTLSDSRSGDVKNYSVTPSPVTIAAGSNGVDIPVTVINNFVVESERSLAISIVSLSYI